jgi:hypothetical protein
MAIGLLLLANTSSILAVELTSAIRYQISADADHPHCVATRIESGGEQDKRIFILTASHCFMHQPRTIYLFCTNQQADANAVVQLERVPVLEFHRHPTHDAALLALPENKHRCIGPGLPVHTPSMTVAEPDETLAVPIVPGFGSTDDPIALRRVLQMSISSLDSETFALQDEVACLQGGDSGYPLLHNGEFVGMLIAGLTGCPTSQTAIRIDRISHWIMRIAESPNTINGS